MTGILASDLPGSGSDVRVLRHDVTDRSASYVPGIGRPFSNRSSHHVGDVWGGLLVRNSGVGFASLTIPSVIDGILRREKLPLRLAPDILSAWDREPRRTAFGISQAVTLAAHDASPELRFELEHAAGAYLASVVTPTTRAN